MEAALRALADESRLTLVEALAHGPVTAGELAALLRSPARGYRGTCGCCGRRGWSRSARKRSGGSTASPEPLAEIDDWLGRYRALWEQRLDALHTEIARGKHERGSSA